MGSAIRYRIVRCTEETQAYPDFFPLVSFLLALLVLGYRHFGRVFSCFPTQPIHIPSRIDRGELSSAIVWPRGSIAAAENGGQTVARHEHQRQRRDPANNTGVAVRAMET